MEDHLTVLQGLNLEDLEDFQRVREHRGWQLFLRIVNSHLDSKKEAVFRAEEGEIHQRVLEVRAVEEVIDLIQQLHNRKETLENDRDYRNDPTGDEELEQSGWGPGYDSSNRGDAFTRALRRLRIRKPKLGGEDATRDRSVH